MQNNTFGYELVLLEKVLKASLSDSQFRKTGFKADSISLPGVARMLSQNPVSSLAENLTIIDEILMERLSIPQTCILVYVSDSYYLAKEEIGKEWSVTTLNQRKILEYLQEILVSYGALSLSEPDMFPEQFPAYESEGIELSAQRMLSFLEKCSEDFLSKLVSYFERENPEFLNLLFQHIVFLLLKEVRNKSLLDDPLRYLQVFKQVLTIKPVSTFLMQHELIDWS